MSEEIKASRSNQNDLVISISFSIVLACLFFSILFGFKDKIIRNAHYIELVETPISGDIIPVGSPNIKKYYIKLCGVSGLLTNKGYELKILEEPEAINYLNEIFKKGENHLKVIHVRRKIGEASYLVYTSDKSTGELINVNHEMIKFLEKKYKSQVSKNKDYRPPYSLGMVCTQFI